MGGEVEEYGEVEIEEVEKEEKEGKEEGVEIKCMPQCSRVIC